MRTINPEKSAIGLQNSLGWTSPADFTLDEIAHSLNLIIKEKPLSGSEGRIVIKEGAGVVTISDYFSSEGKRNFVLAHEIGHFQLHKNSVSLFYDTEMTLNEWYRKGSQEQEANRFATEFLMPRRIFVPMVEGKKLSFSLIKEVSSYFQTSILATFLRYVDYGKFPLMVIYIENGFIKWKKQSSDFPFTWIPKDSKLPVSTVAGDLYYHNATEYEPQLIDAIEWFSEDSAIRYKSDWKLWEQCYRVSPTGLVSCLWTY